MCVVRKPSVPERDRDGKSILSLLRSVPKIRQMDPFPSLFEQKIKNRCNQFQLILLIAHLAHSPESESRSSFPLACYHRPASNTTWLQLSTVDSASFVSLDRLLVTVDLGEWFQLISKRGNERWRSSLFITWFYYRVLVPFEYDAKCFF